MRTTANAQPKAAFTVIELLVCLIIIGILFAFALPAIITSTSCGNRVTQSLSNMKQLHLATQQMALDGTTMTNANLGWPGDTGGTFTNWAAKLVPEYLSTNDFCKLLSVAGAITPQGALPKANTNGIVVYQASERSDGNVIFLSTRNVTNGFQTTPEQLAGLYSGKGFAVFRKGGDGAILLPKQLTGPNRTNIVGVFIPLCR